MRQCFHRIVVGIGLLSFCLAGLGGLMRGGRFWINTSPSVPLGIYGTGSASVTKGALVLFCPPLQPVFENARARGSIGAGFCPGNFGYMIKKIVAVAGDTISVSPQGVTVNGVLLPQSQPLQTDGQGRSLPALMISSYVLKEQELLLMGQASATSFDARYFGVINRAQLHAVLQPLITW